MRFIELIEMIFLLKHLSSTLVTVTQRVIWPGLIGNWSYPFLFIFSLFHTSRTRGRHSMNLLFVEDPRIFSGCCLPKIAPNRNSHKDTVVTEFCCHFFMLNFKLLFNWFRAKISLSCKVFILQTTVLTGLSTREFRTYNLWQISSIIEICLGFQKSNNTWAHLSLWTSCCCKDETSPLFTG